MELKWMAVGALALVPCAALAQGKTAKDTSATHRDSSSSQTTTSTSTGDVSGGGSNVTQAMLAAQNDPNIIGSPAWWKTHATADGKPLGAKSTPSH